MDSYEYYLLFHLDKPAFLNALSDWSSNHDNHDQLATALERLIVNGKVICDGVKKAVLSMVASDNNKVEWILDQVITDVQLLKIWIEQNELESHPPAYFRVVRLLIKKASCSDDTELELFKSLATEIVQYEYREAVTDRPVAIACLRSMMQQQQVAQWVTRELSRKSDRTDSVSLRNLCYFFDAMCEHNCIEDESGIILKYFENPDTSARKQGLFLIKKLIELRKLSTQDEESFQKFIVVVETLEESQHLITPTLELIRQFDFSDKFQDFWFVTCRMVLRHESSLVKQWMLNFILRETPPAPFNEKQTSEILEAFNSTSLLDIFDSLCGEPLKQFIIRNMDCVFQSLIEINWTSFTFYRVIEAIAGNVSRITNIDDEFLENLRLQTEIIPKRIKNLVIRNGVQIQYSKIATLVVTAVGLNSRTLQIISNVFNIGNQYQLLEPCFENLETEDFVALLRPFADNEDFFKFSLVASSQKCSYEQIEQKCRLSASQHSLMVYTMSHLPVESGENLKWLQRAASLLLADLTDAIIAQDEEKVASHIASVRKNSKALMSSGCLEVHFSKAMASFQLLKMEILGPVYLLLRELNVINGKFPEFDGSSTELWRQYQLLEHLEKPTGDVAKYHEILKSNIELCLDECLHDDLLDTLTLVHKMVSLPWPESSSMADLLEKIAVAIFYIDDDKFKLLQWFTDIVLKAADVSLKVPDIDNQLRDSLAFACGKMNQRDKSRIVHHLIESLESHDLLDTPSALKEYIGELLIEQVKETPMLTKEQLTEMQVGHEIESLYCNRNDDDFSISDKRSLRLSAAVLLSEKFAASYPQIIESFMEEFAKASYKKPRYFPNAWIHRMKLHFLQAIFFSATLTPRTIEILVWELLSINNQLNVTYMLEIILARHHPNIVDVLKDEEQVFKLKAPAVKSIFAIAVMQLNQKKFSRLSEEAERSHEKYHDLIFPFTMGQNYGVRAYAQAAIAILHKNVAASSDQLETEFTRRLAKSANIITSSMKFKNAAKFYDALKEDFRYKLTFDDIWTSEVFYNIIPSLTKMPFDEIVTLKNNPRFQSRVYRETFEIAEFNDDPEMSTLTEELLVPATPQVATSNLQMKYKYQVPGDDLTKIYPKMFETAGDLHTKLKKRSNLIVVASLVNRPPNLGGLARTCEIFGAENYVIESLKLVENFEFKAVSKTAEKWLKISEVKPFQLPDFLIGMRSKGYKIVGCEQAAESVSLEEAVIPQKAVLLLGNEKEGIPANLLSLLDLTIEIPQSGVVRSLNVHVSGAVVIWEYFKQHGIK